MRILTFHEAEAHQSHMNEAAVENETITLPLVATVPATNTRWKSQQQYPAAQSEQPLISRRQLPVWALRA